MKLKLIFLQKKKQIIPVSEEVNLVKSQIQIRFRDLGLPVDEFDGEYWPNPAWCLSRFCAE